MAKKILVRVNAGADATSPGIARAAALAEAAGSAIVLLGLVYDPHLEGYLGRSDVYASLRERLIAERQQSLQGLAAELQARGLRCESKALWSNPAHTAVLREAAAPDIDLVVMEPADNRGLAQDDWRLVSSSPAPVLVVRDAAARPYSVVVAAIDPARSFDKPEDLDGKILELAKRFRDLAGGSLEVVHCLPPFRTFIADGIAALAEAENALKLQRTAELAEMLEQAGLPQQAGAVVEGSPPDVLIEHANRAAALVVLGTVQRGPIARLLVGSTAERVLREPGGDIAVIRPSFIEEITADADEESTRHVEVDPSETK